MDSRTDYSEVHKKVTNACKDLNVFKDSGGLYKVVGDIIKDKKANNYDPPVAIPPRTLYNIGQRSEVVTILSEVKNDVRIDGHDLLRSALADVCMLKSTCSVSTP
ncbi:hypothetical protein EON65_12330 [archaeon]|nr:MAG: hypothetical protein EON65_12330 [archaeon]